MKHSSSKYEQKGEQKGMCSARHDYYLPVLGYLCVKSFFLIHRTPCSIANLSMGTLQATKFLAP
jgi:hypothetical protein